jgi:cytochrome P450
MSTSLVEFITSLFPAILLAPLTLLSLHFIYKTLNTRASRRKLIREHGCEPVPKYAHKGILGKLLGTDVIKEMVASAKKGNMHETNRHRNWSNPKINTLQVQALGRATIVTIEPENVKTILATKFGDYSLGEVRCRTFIPLFGHGIFDTDGAAWERSRGLIRPNFVRQQVADLDMFESHVQELISSVPRDGTSVDLQDLFFALTMDSATEFLFGKSTNTLAGIGPEAQRGRDFAESFVYATEAVALEFRTAGLTRWIPDSKWQKSLKIIHSYADDIIAHALEEHKTLDFSKEKKYTFLHELITRTQDPYTLRSELLNVLLAGRDTTAGLLSNTWHVLSKRPDIWAKLKKEIDGLGGQAPDYASIKELKYLRYLLNESLRLMPVVPANSRQAIRDTVLPLGGGPEGRSPLLVKKGQIVSYSPWSMHRRKDFYGPDALEFKPERWENLRPGWEYLPYVQPCHMFQTKQANYFTDLTAAPVSVSVSNTPFSKHLM